jgi:hypothetical protein
MFVSLVSIYKLFFKKPIYVYAKVKVGQGLWWSSTQKPPIWFLDVLKKGNEELDLFGDTKVKVLSVRYYPWYNTSQYDIYLTLKLRVNGNKQTRVFNFNRSTLGVGSPIDLTFSNTEISGTVTKLSSKSLNDQYIEKTINLKKKWAFPWEYDAIQIGDSYFDGENTVFQIIDKKETSSFDSYSSAGNNYPIEAEPKKNITIRAKIKVQQKSNRLVFGEEQIINPGRAFSISLSNFTLQDYVIGAIE